MRRSVRGVAIALAVCVGMTMLIDAAAQGPSVAPPPSLSAEDAGSPRDEDPAGSAPDPKRT